jgi:N-acyl-D-aspartate/D-glutamate deacylase
MPEVVHDLPAGAKRLLQKSTGLKATVVNGAIVLNDNEPTGNYTGRVLRSGA